MTNPEVAVLQLAVLVFTIMLGFPVAFTLMALGVGFGYYAYYDHDLFVRTLTRLGGEDPGFLGGIWAYFRALLSNRIFDLFVNQTYSVMSNDVLTAIPLFLFMGYIVERANIVNRLFRSLQIASRGLPGSLAVAALVTCALFATATGIVGAVVTLMGLLALPAMLQGALRRSLRDRRHLRRRLARHSDPAVDHAHRLRRDRGRLGRPALCRRAAARLPARRPLCRLCRHAGIAQPEARAEDDRRGGRRTSRRCRSSGCCSRRSSRSPS